MKCYRQGDVVIRSLEKMLNVDLTPKADSVLAEGAATGHRHRITKGQVELQVNALMGLMILKVLSDEATIGHDEHDDIILPTGIYEVKTQREFDWWNEEVRRVCD